MKKEYDFTNALKNPYAKKLKQPITIRVDESSINYFKKIAQEMDLPYQTLINLFLRDCAVHQRRPKVTWMN